MGSPAVRVSDVGGLVARHEKVARFGYDLNLVIHALEPSGRFSFGRRNAALPPSNGG